MIPPAPASGAERLLRRGLWRRLLLTTGPGLVVMLADTEAGSVIAAAQGGARWGYRLLLLQAALVPALFMAQELSSRLGLATRQGLAELALRRLGRVPAVALLATLTASCAGALVTELSGLAGVGELYGVPPWATSAAATAALLAIVLNGSHRSVERIAIAAGLCELVFIVLAWQAGPQRADIAAQMWDIPVGDPGYLYLVAASIGTCVIPWAVFYQQSASIDKGLTRQHLIAARVETLGGAFLCQGVTAAVLVAAAAATPNRSFDRVGDIAVAFGSVIGPLAGQTLFALGLGGGALVASIVVCLTAARAFTDVAGRRHSLDDSPARAPWFYGAFAAILAAGGALVASGVNLVRLATATGVLNAVLLPVVLAFLFHLSRRALPPDVRPTGAYAIAVAVTFAAVGGLGLYASLASAF